MTRRDEIRDASLIAVWAVGGRRVPVQSIEDAVAKWEAFREQSGGGVSEIGNGLRLLRPDGSEVARISYNGRVWPV